MIIIFWYYDVIFNFWSRIKRLNNQTLLNILAHHSHQNHSSSRASTDSQQQSQVSAAEIMSAAGLAAMAAAELGNNLRYCNNARTRPNKYELWVR